VADYMTACAADATVAPESAPAPSTGWRFASALVLSTIFWLLVWYGDTAAAVVTIWARSETFAHGFLIIPISAWLIWRQRDAVVGLRPQPNYFVLALLALVGFGWLLGHLADAGVVQQFALILMIPLLAWSVLGNRVAWALAFPLFFLLFAVPFGEFLEQPLMEHTADFTVTALRLTGIPVYREGQFFMIPSGSWSVVEACSGLRYLIASLTLGFLYAYLMYRSLLRRAIFVVLSVVVPVVANWLRAYMIVIIGHVSGMKYATGIDHLIYGWLFFGIVMLILFWIGSFWREDQHTGHHNPIRAVQRGEFRWPKILAGTIAAAITVAIWPVVAARLDSMGSFSAAALHAPQPSSDWQTIIGHLSDWKPRFSDPRAWIRQSYEKDGKRVEIDIGYYRQQRRGSQLISSQNVLVSSNDWTWRNIGETRRTLDVGSVPLQAIEATLAGQSAQLLVWHWYWVGGQYVVNPYWAKLLQAKSTLFGTGDDGAVVIVYTVSEGPTDVTRRALREFVVDMLPAITASLENARRR
jgi:exosortase A